MADHYFCVHGHFYQPPRGNPFDDDLIGVENGAQPYRNFNEKITAECYTPNADLGNFGLMSFNLGATLARWLELHAPETYAKIVAADQAQRAQWGAGNALAQPAHHTILPLCRKRDKRVQVEWGLMSFEHRFGHAAEGMWLPEMAVDLETLQVLHDAGVKFTILAQSQLKGANEGAGPYWVKLPSGERMVIYARDDRQSNELAFNIQSLGGAGRWARNTLTPLRKSYPRFLLIATDGETYGYHHFGEEHFLHWLLEFEANSVGFEVTTLGRDLREHEPVAEIEINEYTAWSCWHGLNRWSNGCECTAGDSRWKPALRRAFDNLASWVDEGYLEYTRELSQNPWALRTDYFRVRLGELSESEFLSEAGLSGLPADKAKGLLALLLAQFYRQRMYVSGTFYFEDLDRPEPLYGIANALRAILLEGEAIGGSYVDSFRQDLKLAVSNKNSKTGAQVLDEALGWARAAGYKTEETAKARDHSPPTQGQRLHADRYHTGVRVITLFMWIVAIGAAYIVLDLIATQIFGPIAGLGVLLLLIGAIVAAQPLAWLGERQLIAHWPSGRDVQLEPGALVWHDHGASTRIDLGQKVNYWRWRFAIGRRRSGRIPGNHHCFALRLVQGDTVVTLYTFFPPAVADSLSARFSFYELRRPNDPAKTSLGGRDAIFLAAEHTRWDEGAELDPGDFEALLAHLAANLPEFPRSAQSGI